MRKEYVYRGKTYPVYFVEKTKIVPAFGCAYGTEYAVVRHDLHPLVQRFVIQHELYHLQDERRGGVFLRELRANLIPGMRDPIGLIACILATLLSKERRRLYIDRVRKNY